MTTLWPKLLALLALLVALVGGAALVLHRVRSDGQSAQQAVDAKAALAQSEASRQQEALHAAQAASAVANAQAATLTVALAGNRIGAALDDSVRRNSARPSCPVPAAGAASGPGDPASAPDVVPAELYRGLGTVAAQLAAYADSAHIAGQLCQAVTP